MGSLDNRHINVAVLGAGSRGHAYAAPITQYQNSSDPESYIPGRIVAVAEPNPWKLNDFGKKYIWGIAGRDKPNPGEAWSSWEEWVAHAHKLKAAGELLGVDAVIICVLDELHIKVLEALADLDVHILCEKPLVPKMEDIQNVWKWYSRQDRILGVCHVLRYSPHNQMLRTMIRGNEQEESLIGEILSVEHTEPVGWWHFSHSYVRGNWRKESKTAPSLMTKSCHDIDFLMWMLCSPQNAESFTPPHLPAFVSSTGSRKLFRKVLKPAAAGDATNCLSCPIEKDCIYSAKKIYSERHLAQGNTYWPVCIVNPEIEDCYKSDGLSGATNKLLESLREDYSKTTPQTEIDARPWFGRCVWESDNDVNDDQFVTLTWEDDPLEQQGLNSLKHRIAKTAQFHMIAFTEMQCQRRGWVYGTKGEVEYDSTVIKVHTFADNETKIYYPKQLGGGHGGGDSSLTRQFVLAVHAAVNEGVPAEEASKKYLGCTLEEEIRSHAMVFAAEEARRNRSVVDWAVWWRANVEAVLQR